MPRGTGRYDEALRQGRLWTPRALGSALAGWWDLSDVSTITADSSGYIGTVTDKSGSGRDATQGTLASKMIYLPASAEESRPAAGSGTISTHTGTVLTLASLAGTGWTAGEMFYVIRRDAQLVGGAGLLGNFGSGGSNNHEPFTDGNIYCTTFNSSRSAAFAPTKTFDTAVRIVNVRSGSSSWQYLIDGTVEKTEALAFALPSVPKIGSDFGTANAKYFEVLMVGSRKLATAESDAMHGYLAWKHRIVANLPGGHPYKNRPPLIGD